MPGIDRIGMRAVDSAVAGAGTEPAAVVQSGDENQVADPSKKDSAQTKQADRMTDAATAKARVQGMVAPTTPQLPKYGRIEQQRFSEHACFHKVESDSKAEYTGISGDATLPDVTIDPHRAQPEKNTPPRDRPSVYMGGNAKSSKGGEHEVDAGLSWDRVYTKDGEATWTTDSKGWSKPPTNHVYVQRQVHNADGQSTRQWQQLTLDKSGREISSKPISDHDAGNLKLTPNCAFRPYVRTTNQGPNASQEEKNKQWHTPQTTSDSSGGAGKPANAYFYPGEKIHMSFGEDKDHKGQVKLSISTTGDPQDGAGSKNFEMTQSQKGWPGDTRSFKRINSVDEHATAQEEQRYPKGTTIPTRTTVTNASWGGVNLETAKGQVPLELAHSTNVRDIHGSPDYRGAGKYNYKDVFHVQNGSPADPTSENISITPPKPHDH